MRIGIVGAGPAGLACLKHSLAEGFEPTAFDQNPEVGGEWYHTGATGKDKYGIDIHSSIYDGLITNVPKQTMEYPGFPYPEDTPQYNSPDVVLSYFKSFADQYNLRPHIKLEHHVIRIRPLHDDMWEVIVRDLPNNQYKTFIFDKIFICIGISAPYIPKMKGQEVFKGETMHAHDFRNTKMFENKRVLLIGSGASSVEMMVTISKVASHLTWVERVKEVHGFKLKISFPPNVDTKHGVEKFTEYGAEFDDGSAANYDIVAYATGYDFRYPFLSVDSGVSVYQKFVAPFYKHIINVNRSSMAFIGLPFISLAVPMFDLQVRFCLQYWSGRRMLPSKEEMMADIERDIERRKAKGNFRNTNRHYLGHPRHMEYYVDLAETSGIEPLKPVLGKIFSHVSLFIYNDNPAFKQHKYVIVNDNEFEYH